MRKLLITSMVAAGLLLPVGFASAQDAPKPPPAAGAPDKPGHPPRVPLTERVAKHLTKLKADLKITSAQEGAWKAYADTVTAQAADMEKKMADMRAERAKNKGNPPTAIERLQLRQTMMTEGAARTADLIKVATPLYDSLSPEQKRIADREMARLAGGPEHRPGDHKGPPPPDGLDAPDAPPPPAK